MSSNPCTLTLPPNSKIRDPKPAAVLATLASQEQQVMQGLLEIKDTPHHGTLR